MTDDGDTYPGRGLPRHGGHGQRGDEPQWPADEWPPPAGEWAPADQPVAPPARHRQPPPYPGQPDPLADPGPSYQPRRRRGYPDPGPEPAAYNDGPPPGYRDEQARYLDEQPRYRDGPPPARGTGRPRHGTGGAPGYGPGDPRGYGGDDARGYAADDPRGYSAGDPRGYPGDAPRYDEPAFPGGGPYPGRPGDGAYPGDGRYAGRERYPSDGGYPGDGSYSGEGRYAEPGPHRGEDRYAGDPRRAPGENYDRAAGPAEGPPWEDDGYDDNRFVPGLSGPPDDPGDGRRGRRGGSSGRGGKRGRSRVAVLIAVLVILTPVVVGAFFAFRFVQGKYFPADYSTAGTGQVVVQVQPGQTATSVAPRLVSLGVVASSRAFVLAAEHSPNQTGLEPGLYRLHKQMKASLAYALMLSPSSRVQNKITIPEGWRVSQILAALGAHSGIPAADFQKALSDPGSLGLPSYANGKPEGYLFPATYDIQPNMTATAVLQTMVQQFNSYAASINLTKAAAAANLTPSQLVTVASLLQAEGGRLSDYPKIARVVYNRLAAGMPLQFDSTVFYGLGEFGTAATNAQLQSTSPYNTYKYKGLPPGPIDSPGNAAFQAALHPAAGNWLYFVSSKNGVTKFSSTLAGLGG
jgi:UPF0755 protein